jgi:hypothetical protein
MRAHQRVSDFMEKRVLHLLLGIEQGHLPTERDRPQPVLTEAESADGPVKLEAPMGEAVAGHEALRDRFGIV